MSSVLNDDASSNPIGIILAVVITLVIAAIILAQLLQLPSLCNEPVPAIFKITKIRHVDENGVLNFDSYMVLINKGSSNYKNQKLYAKTYVNGIEVNCKIPTLNADAFCHSSHIGVERIGGLGSAGSMLSSKAVWCPNQYLWIDYSRDTFHPGDTVKIEIFDTVTNTIISRDTYRA